MRLAKPQLSSAAHSWLGHASPPSTRAAHRSPAATSPPIRRHHASAHLRRALLVAAALAAPPRDHTRHRHVPSSHKSTRQGQYNNTHSRACTKGDLRSSTHRSNKRASSPAASARQREHHRVRTASFAHTHVRGALHSFVLRCAVVFVFSPRLAARCCVRSPRRRRMLLASRRPPPPPLRPRTSIWPRQSWRPRPRRMQQQPQPPPPPLPLPLPPLLSCRAPTPRSCRMTPWLKQWRTTRFVSSTSRRRSGETSSVESKCAVWCWRRNLGVASRTYLTRTTTGSVFLSFCTRRNSSSPSPSLFRYISRRTTGICRTHTSSLGCSSLVVCVVSACVCPLLPE